MGTNKTKSTQSKDNAKSQAKSLKPFNKKMNAQIQSKDLSLFFKNYYHEKFETPEQIPSMMCRQTNDLKQFLTLSKLKKEFDSKIQQFDNKMGFFAYKDSQLDKRMDGLQSSGVKYHNFMTKSIKKTELISKKTKEERKKRIANQRKISELKVHVKEVQKESDKYKEKINKNEVYQDYMDKVLANSEGFFDMSDVIKRYDTLVATQVKLHEKDERKQERLIAKKAQLARYKKSKENEIQEYNNEIARLQERLDKAKSNAADWEGKCAEVQKQTNKHNLLLGKLKASTDSMFAAVAKNQSLLVDKDNTPFVSKKLTTIAKLNRIRVFMMDLSEVIREQESKAQEKK